MQFPMYKIHSPLCHWVFVFVCVHHKGLVAVVVVDFSDGVGYGNGLGL